MSWCPCFPLLSTTHLSEENEFETETFLSEKIGDTFNEIGARRLDVSVPRYIKLKQMCHNNSAILHRLHDEGYLMNVNGIEIVIMRELAKEKNKSSR